MTPYQIGFLASRIIAVFCLVYAASYFSYAAEYAFGPTRRSDPPGMFVYALVPFAVTSLLTVLLWVRAGTLAALFVPEDKEAGKVTGSLGPSLFRVLGLSFVVSDGAILIQVLYQIFFMNGSDRSWQELRYLLEIYRRPGLAVILEFMIGAVLLVGADRLWKGILKAPSRVWKATSLPDEE